MIQGQNSNHFNAFNKLVSDYEAMSQQGTVGFIEEPVIWQLVEHYEGQNQLDRAIDVIDHAIAQFSYSADFYLQKARLLCEQGKVRHALACLDDADALLLGEPEADLMRAELLAACDRNEEAFVILHRLKAELRGKELSNVHFCEACIYEQEEQFKKMFIALEQTLRLNPKHHSALERVWFSMELAGLYGRGVNLHQFLLDEDPYNHIAWYNLGYAYFCLKQFKKAIDAFEYAYLIQPDFVFAYRDCAESWIALGQFDKSLNCLEELLQHCEPDSELMVCIGRCYEGKREFVLAQQSYRRAIELNPNNDNAYFAEGACFFQQDNWMAAIKALSKAIELNDRREEYYIALAETYFQVDDEEQARNLYEQAVNIAPEQPTYWIQYARFLLDIGEGREAQETLEDAMCNTGGVDLTYSYSACLFVLGRRKEGFVRLCEGLSEAYDLHNVLFDFAPELEEDLERLAAISACRP